MRSATTVSRVGELAGLLDSGRVSLLLGALG
jgi:hypothetical protein